MKKIYLTHDSKFTKIFYLQILCSAQQSFTLLKLDNMLIISLVMYSHPCNKASFWGRILCSTCSCVFGFFGGFWHVFLMYSCSKSFRELKNAIKNQFFLYLGGLGAKLRFLSKKTCGERYSADLPFIHGCTPSSACQILVCLCISC